MNKVEITRKEIMQVARHFARKAGIKRTICSKTYHNLPGWKKTGQPMPEWVFERDEKKNVRQEVRRPRPSDQAVRFSEIEPAITGYIEPVAPKPGEPWFPTIPGKFTYDSPDLEGKNPGYIYVCPNFRGWQRDYYRDDLTPFPKPDYHEIVGWNLYVMLRVRKLKKKTKGRPDYRNYLGFHISTLHGCVNLMEIADETDFLAVEELNEALSMLYSK
jgi:hypothetical protein